jgi:hypothetical protein
VGDQATGGEPVRRTPGPEADVRFDLCQAPAQAIPTAEAVRPAVIPRGLVLPDSDGPQPVKPFRADPAARDTPAIEAGAESARRRPGHGPAGVGATPRRAGAGRRLPPSMWQSVQSAGTAEPGHRTGLAAGTRPRAGRRRRRAGNGRTSMRPFPNVYLY